MESLELANHRTKMCDFIIQQYDDNSLCDVAINTSDGKQILAHKVVLAAFSEYFHRQIELTHHSTNSCVFDVDFNFNCMKSLTDFMYKGKLNVSLEQKSEIYAASVDLNISTAQSLLLESFTSSSFDMLNTATKKRTKSLRKSTKPSRRITKTDETLKFSISSDLLTWHNAIPKLKIKAEKIDDSDYVGQGQNLGNNFDLEQDGDDDLDDDLEVDPDFTPPSKKKSSKSKTKRKSVKKKSPESKTKFEKIRKRLFRKVLIPFKCERCCKICKKKFKSHISIFRHLAVKHNKFGADIFLSKLIVNRCIKQLLYSKLINRKVYENTSKVIFRCSKCKKTFSNYRNLVFHVKKSHSSKTIFSKRLYRNVVKFISAKKLFYQSKLKKKQLKETPSNKVQCTQCSAYLSHPRHLSNHMIKIHKLTNQKAAALTGYPKNRKNSTGGRISCTLCPDIFSSVKALKLHTSNVHKSQTYIPPCSECGDLFKTITALKNHLRLIHGKTRAEIQDLLGVKQVCEVEGCKFSSPSTHALNVHVSDSHPGVEYKCSECAFTCHLKSMRDKHYITSHLNREKNFKNVCQICGKRFGKKAHCLVHEYTKHGIKHPSVQLFKCNFDGCDYTCVFKSSLRSHQSRHTEEKKFECQFCGIKLKTKTTYTKHINKIHLGIRPHLCQVCGATFGEESELSAHINNKHATEKQFQCDYCPYATSTKNTFFTHLFMVHKTRAQDDKRKEFICAQCGFLTLLKSRFRTHMNGHKNIREHVCPECGKQFISRSTLVAHKQWQHSSKVYTCTQCEYRTKTVQKLNEHIRVQHQLRGFKPYRCPYCDFTCATGGNCRKHVKQKHKDEEVRYIRDDSLIEAARIARQSGNNAPLIGSDLVMPSIPTSSVDTADDDEMIKMDSGSSSVMKMDPSISGSMMKAEAISTNAGMMMGDMNVESYTSMLHSFQAVNYLGYHGQPV